MKSIRIHLLSLIALAAIVVSAIIHVTEIWSYPSTYSIGEFPLIAQPDSITCGPTSIAMLLNKYGIKATVSDVKARTKTELFRWDDQEIGGTCPEYIEDALEGFGLRCEMEYARLDELKYYVSHNRPPIALLRSGETTWHYVVVVGYDKTHIEVADPFGGYRRKMPVDHFVGGWSFSTDMRGTEMEGVLAEFLSFLVMIGEARANTLIVPSVHIT